MIEDLLEGRALGRQLRVEVGRRLVGLLQKIVRKGLELGAARDELAQGDRVQRVVFRRHVGGGRHRRRPQKRAVAGGQFVPLVDVDEEAEAGGALPETGIVIIGCDLHEAETLVVEGADELGRVQNAALQGRIDVARRDLGRHEAEALEDVPGEAADAHLEAVQIRLRLDLLAEPAAHLRAGAAGRQVVELVARVELVEEVVAPSLVEPGVLLARVRPERHAGAEGEGRILADVEIGAGLPHLDRAARDAVDDGEGRDDLARMEDLDLEAVVARLGHHLREQRARAVDRVERRRIARLQPPRDGRLRLRDGGRGDRRSRAQASSRDERASLHGHVSPEPFCFVSSVNVVAGGLPSGRAVTSSPCARHRRRERAP